MKLIGRRQRFPNFDTLFGLTPNLDHGPYIAWKLAFRERGGRSRTRCKTLTYLSKLVPKRFKMLKHVCVIEWRKIQYRAALRRYRMNGKTRALTVNATLLKTVLLQAWWSLLRAHVAVRNERLCLFQPVLRARLTARLFYTWRLSRWTSAASVTLARSYSRGPRARAAGAHTHAAHDAADNTYAPEVCVPDISPVRSAAVASHFHANSDVVFASMAQVPRRRSRRR